MTLKEAELRKYFINVIPAENEKDIKVRFNKREFLLKDIKSWKHYLRNMMGYFLYACLISEVDPNIQLGLVLRDVNKDRQGIMERMGKLLGGGGF